ncbi:hypothetical protein BJX96DRAFT_165705 [Aspergillus floccosus]
MDDDDDSDPPEDLPIIMGIPAPDTPQDPSSIHDLRQLLFPPTSEVFLASREPGSHMHPRCVFPPLYRKRESQKSCRHGMLEHRYCLDKEDTCQMCGRRPFPNWLYYCVEDQGDYTLPINPFVSPVFTPWAQRYIEEGVYTTEQREIIIQQKIKVLQTAAHQRRTQLAPLMPSLLDTAPSVAASSDTDDDDSDSELWIEDVKAVNQPATRPAPHGPSPWEADADTFDKPMLPTPCSFSACQYCEWRLYRFQHALAQRMFLSLDEVCTDPSIRVPTAWDLRDRPISHADLVRNLGWRSRPSASVVPDGARSGTVPSPLRRLAQRRTVRSRRVDILSPIAELDENGA